MKRSSSHPAAEALSAAFLTVVAGVHIVGLINSLVVSLTR